MLSPLPNHSPFQAAHQALRKDPAILQGLNAASKRTYRTVPDVVLLLCAEAYLPELGFGLLKTYRLDEHRDALTEAVMEHLRARKAVEHVPITRLVVHAVRLWLENNLAEVGDFGAARWKHEYTIRNAPPLVLKTWDEYLQEARAAIAADPTTGRNAEELARIYRNVDIGKGAVAPDLTTSGWPC
jgi:hypothetical protein